MNIPSDEAAILAVLDAFKRAVMAKDAAAYLALYSEEVRVFDFWGVWAYDGGASWKNMVMGWFGSLNELRDEVSFNEARITLANGLSVVTAFVRFNALDADGRAVRGMDERITLVLQNQNGTWKIIHQHTSAPIDGKSMQPTLQRSPA